MQIRKLFDFVRKISMGIKHTCLAFEQFTVDVIYNRKQTTAGLLYGVLLQAISYIFYIIVKIRTFCYRNYIFRSESLGCLVVVVGNLTVGGTGKTPIVEKFAKSLLAQGRTVAILSRGYKSKSEPFYRALWHKLLYKKPTKPKIVSNGRQVLLNSEEAGDEAYMLACNLPGVVVAVDKDRIKSASYVIKHFGVDAIILDDGFQYLPLKSHLNLMLIDQTNPFGNGHLLPRGILREPISHMNRASYLFITKSNGNPPETLLRDIKIHAPLTEIITCTHAPQHLTSVFEKIPQLPIEWLQGQNVAVFSGIAAPESFEEQLKSKGAHLVYTERFLDHHRFEQEELYSFYCKAAISGASAIITTQKDAVRLPDTLVPPLPMYYLKLEINILDGGDDFQDAVARICFPKDLKQRA